jgi:hypothetical protein
MFLLSRNNFCSFGHKTLDPYSDPELVQDPHGPKMVDPDPH